MSAARRIDAGGLFLHAQVEGAGHPVVLLHGFTGSGRGMAGLAEGLRDARRAIRIDLVGHGRSDAPRDPALYAMPRCAEQVLRVLDALGAERSHLLGYSMGGRVALWLCAAHPERVASAVLVGASAGIADPAERAARARRDRTLADVIERDGLPAFVDAWMAQPLFATQRRLGEEALAQQRAERLANRPHGLAASLRGMGAGAQPPLHERLPGVRVPIRLVVGELDAKFRGIAADLSKRLPNARVKLVPGTGHAAHLEDPQAVLRLARRFFADVEQGLRPPRPPRERAPAQPPRTTAP